MAGARLSRIAVKLSCCLLLGGCGITQVGDLNFRVDKRLEFRSPADRSTVHAPVTIVWTMRDFTVVGPGRQAPRADAGYFAIFVDSTPIGPGKALDSLGDGDPACSHVTHCVNAEYLEAHQIYTTTATTFRLPPLADPSSGSSGNPLHSLTVILLDSSGRRIGESAWELDLRIAKEGSS